MEEMDKLGLKIMFSLPNGTNIYKKINQFFCTKYHIFATK